jgi:ADP-dependent phosphofructokinase/glucokinase
VNHELVLGLGGCVDYEISWDSRVLEDLVTFYGLKAADLDASVPVSDERSLVASVLAFVRDGVGGERFIASSEIVEEFASRFTKRITLGGSCVRAALAMQVLGVPATVHLVSIDDNVRRLLPGTVRYLSSATRDTLDPHLIIQFPAGTTIRSGDIGIRAPHPNRIIYTNDPPNRDLVLADDLPDALATADVFLVAGFNVMRDEALLRDRLATLNAAIPRMPTGAVVLYEDAGFHDPGMRAIVRHDLTGVGVHSMNEDEFQHYLARSLDLLDLDQVVSALQESVAFGLAPVVVVHTKYWSLAYGETARQYREALQGGIDLASTLYSCGDHFTLADYERVRSLPSHTGGRDFSHMLEDRLGDAACCVPAHALDAPNPTTIGLGDTFVGGFVAALGRTLREGREGAARGADSDQHVRQSPAERRRICSAGTS